MNVLVYAGPEALQRSVTHALNTLRSILLPQYSVQTISLQALNSQPWNTSCTLIVIPQCRGIFQPAASAVIREYVESGGSLLGLGMGAICSRRDQGTAAGISKDLLLGFFDKLTGRYVYLTSGTDDPIEARALHAPDNELIGGISSRASSAFTGFEGEKNISILATYSGNATSIAGLKCDIGAGRIAIWASNIEIPIAKETVSTVPTAAQISAEEKGRLDLLKRTLTNLSLQLPSVKEPPILRPLPQFLTSDPGKFSIVARITDLVAAPSSGSQLSVFNDDNDTLHFHHQAKGAEVVKEAQDNPSPSDDPSEWQPKHVILCPDALPNRELTPLFDLRAYYESLSNARTKQGCPEYSDPWGCGEALLYGEVVTSTQTMLDR